MYWNFLGIRHSLCQSGGELSMSRMPWQITWPSRTSLHLRVEESGLTIYPSHAFLGATSDGWVYDESMPEGNQKVVLEIKCPYSISNDVITHREVHFFIPVNVNVFIIIFFCFYESINSIYEQYIYLLYNTFTSWQGGKVFVLRSQRMAQDL